MPLFRPRLFAMRARPRIRASRRPVLDAPIRPVCKACPSLISMHDLAEALGEAVDAKDSRTAHHSREVADLSEALARILGLTDMQTERVHVAAHLHDIGKIGVPEAILTKAEPLSPEEFAAIREHPGIGARILAPCFARGPWSVTDMVLGHHERFDGGGYPHGLRGADIPFGARLIALADAYSAMRQDRPYRSGMSHRAALAEIERCAGTMFDPDMAREFLLQEEIMRRVRDRARPERGQRRAA